MKTKVLALYGSPRRGGNTDLLMQELIAGISRDGGVEVTKLYLGDLNIKPCTGCASCETSGTCHIQDDMQMIYPLIEESRIIAVSSPVYFYGVSAQCKAMIDRTHIFWARKYILKRPWSEDDDLIRQGIFISAAGTDRADLFTGGELTIKYFFDCIDILYQGSILVTNVQEPGEVSSNHEAFKEAYNKGVELMNPY